MNSAALPLPPDVSPATPRLRRGATVNVGRVLFTVALFCCGAFAWVFKLKGEGDDGMLPVSPL